MFYKSCEIIRDRQTMNSLQYAFIEFDNPKSCEDAYFKMDNVLIDDRRIHVDFSQSVSRLQWKGKGMHFYYLRERVEVNRSVFILGRGVDFIGGKPFDPNKEDYKMKGPHRKEQGKYVQSDDYQKRREPQQRPRDYQPRNSEYRENRDDRGRRDEREHRDRYEHRNDRDRRDERVDSRGRRSDRDHRDNREHRDQGHNRDRREKPDRREHRDHRERHRSPDRSRKEEYASPQKRIRRSKSPKSSHRTISK